MYWPTPADYQEAIQNPKSCFADPELRSGSPTLDRLGLPKPVTGGFASVYEMQCARKKYAVRCFLRYLPDREQRYAVLSAHLRKFKSPYMVSFEFLKQGIRVRGQWYPILKMEWVDGEPLDIYVERNLGNGKVMLGLARSLLDVIGTLKKHSIAHGDLQHGNILVSNGQIRLIDYDGMYVPDLAGQPSQEVGHRNYQHPRRSGNDFGPYLDGFSAWIIYGSLIALSMDPGLWRRLDGGDECLLFKRSDFDHAGSSQAMTTLEKSSNPSIRAMGSHLKQILYGPDWTRVPELDPSFISGAKPTSVPSPAQPPSSPRPRRSGTGSRRGSRSGSRPGSRRGSAQAQVLVDNRPLQGSLFLERTAAFMYGIWAAALWYLTREEYITMPAALTGLGTVLLPVLLVMIFRFRSFHEVSERGALFTRISSLRRLLQSAEETLARCRAERERISREDRRETDAINAKRTELAARERDEIDRIDQEMNARLAAVTPQLQRLVQAQQAELAKALRDLQSQHVKNQLARFDISGADIPGVSPAVKRQLAAAGAKTAADILDVKVVQFGAGKKSDDVAYVDITGKGSVPVEGLDSAKGKAVLNWRRGLESKFTSQIPRTLPPQDDARIRRKYQARQTLEAQEKAARQDAQVKKDRVRTRYRHLTDALSRNVADLRDGLAKAYANLDKTETEARERISRITKDLTDVERQFEAYRNVTFTAYLKRILLFL